MRRRCNTCICRTCLNTCCDRKTCGGKKKNCSRYKGFKQLSIFEIPKIRQHYGTPRHPLRYYGLTKKRVVELEGMIQSGMYNSIASQAAHTACEEISEYILLSVAKNKSYDALKIKWELKEIEQIPYGRSDFYGIRRYFFSIFNEKMKEIGK